jgi:hypothetical protein
VRINRGLLGWGVFFIVVGVVPLAVQQGLVDEEVARRAWQLWPLILIGIGLGLVLRHTRAALVGGLVVSVTFGLMVGSALAVGFAPVGFGSCGIGSASGEGDPFPTQSGTLDPDARVSVDMSCGELAIGATAGSGWTLSGSSEGGQAPEITGTGSRLTVRGNEHQGLTFLHASKWSMTLPTGTVVRLDLSVNAGSTRANLGGMQVPDFDLSVNAGDAKVDLSEAVGTASVNASANAGSLSLSLPTPQGTLTGDLSANAGSIKVCVPDGVALRIQSGNSPLGSYNFAGAGLTHDGDVWVRSRSASGSARIDLSVSANLGSITLNPEGGCD